MRKKLIAGNWKMNLNIEQSEKLTSLILEKLNEDIFNKTDVVLCPPFTSLFNVHTLIKNSKIKLGAQNIHYKDEGAYTGEISASMIKSVGCEFVILGHSERRQYFYETDETVNLKIKKALEFSLIPIVCVGETITERESGIHETVVENQVVNSLKDISPDQLKNIIFAYEPVWAIGTGHTATPIQANSMHRKIRTVIENLYSNDIANTIKILYGGSVNEKNSADLFSQPDIDGGLVGGASLKPDSFTEIILSA
ncbi:MAG: triose-phosphate isomerase [Ignavibacteria bacterium]|nr:triose-phosphate isomerase [Ignavibacteria bacterium]